MPAGTHSREEWTAIASGLDLRRGAFIDGELIHAASGRTFDRIDPATGAWCDADPADHKLKDDLDQVLTVLINGTRRDVSWR